MKNGIKRKIAALSIGVMALGGVTAVSVAAAPPAQAATSSTTYMWHPWNKQCQQFEHIKYSAIGKALGYKDYTVFRGVVPNWVCGR